MSDDLLRVLVLEDEWVARDFLVEILERTGIAAVVGAVSGFDDAAAFLRGVSTDDGIDVVFVDIHLVGSRASGLDLVRTFARSARAPAFVFATALQEHALEAFALGAADYVLKPFDEERIGQCLVRLRDRQRVAVPAPRRPLRIVARNKRNLVFLHPEEAWAFESADGLTLVHSGRGTFDVDLSLEAVAASFGRSFTRVHRNWLVNEEHVLELEREPGETSLLVGGRTTDGHKLRVPVSRDRAAAVRGRLVGESVGIRKR